VSRGNLHRNRRTDVGWGAQEGAEIKGATSPRRTLEMLQTLRGVRGGGRCADAVNAHGAGHLSSIYAVIASVSVYGMENVAADSLLVRCGPHSRRRSSATSAKGPLSIC
jgi:hypothetical protein